MSIGSEILSALPNVVSTIVVNKEAMLHGEKAIAVTAHLINGKTVEGTFTTEAKPGFGGVTFSSQKDVPALMIAKINSVLGGTAE